MQATAISILLRGTRLAALFAAFVLLVVPVTALHAESADTANLKTVDQDVQSLKKQLIDLNRDLFKLEEELLYPASTQVAVFLSVDVGTFFALDSVTLKVDDKEVANYLYTEREVEALHRGGVQKLYLGNLKAGQHEITAFFTGKGPHERDYRRGTTLQVEKAVGAKYVELRISDREASLQPEFVVKQWE
ncbi:MAG: AraC family transcriptional regulator [Gammaproteobacteria bacterium]|nr:AraC family transcriptional regulator [Gammaproteobacteria bacterium]MDH5228086.1 AraC family transcriptional regulator [Gammaproteobacteria bacterium]